jgi:hypothetical protein
MAVATLKPDTILPSCLRHWSELHVSRVLVRQLPKLSPSFSFTHQLPSLLSSSAAASMHCQCTRVGRDGPCDRSHTANGSAMSVQIASLNYSAHVWSPASWGDLDGFQGLLGVGAPSRTPKPDFFAGAPRMRARTRAGAPPTSPFRRRARASLPAACCHAGGGGGGYGIERVNEKLGGNFGSK